MAVNSFIKKMFGKESSIQQEPSLQDIYMQMRAEPMEGEQILPAIRLPESSPRLTSDQSFTLYRHNAFDFEGNVQILERGAGEDKLNSIEFLQHELVENGYLNANVMSGQYGYMKGTLTTSAVQEIQEALSAAGADIKVQNGRAEKGEAGRVIIDHEVWAALRALREYGGKEAMKDPARAALVTARYEQIKDYYDPERGSRMADALEKAKDSGLEQLIKAQNEHASVSAKEIAGVPSRKKELV